MRRHWLGALVGLCVLGLASSVSHAATINAHGVFDVTYRGIPT